MRPFGGGQGEAGTTGVPARNKASKAPTVTGSIPRCIWPSSAVFPAGNATSARAAASPTVAALPAAQPALPEGRKQKEFRIGPAFPMEQGGKSGPILVDVHCGTSRPRGEASSEWTAWAACASRAGRPSGVAETNLVGPRPGGPTPQVRAGRLPMSRLRRWVWRRTPRPRGGPSRGEGSAARRLTRKPRVFR